MYFEITYAILVILQRKELRLWELNDFLKVTYYYLG